MPDKIDLLDYVKSLKNEGSFALEAVRLDGNQVALVPFTTDSESVIVHFCAEAELVGYIACNGPGCVLCRIGRKPETRFLLPVFLPASGTVGVLPVSLSCRPHALLPQLASILEAAKPVVVFVSREASKYSISVVPLQEDMADGGAAIAEFKKNYESGSVQLASIFPRVPNEQLAGVQEIARMLALKGGTS